MIWRDPVSKYRKCLINPLNVLFHKWEFFGLNMCSFSCSENLFTLKGAGVRDQDPPPPPPFQSLLGES